MTRRESHSAQTWGFESLPCELRHQILEHLLHQAGTEQRLSAWAHVSREWQRFFEPDTFECLSLQTPGADIRQLKYVVVNGRQKLVRKISLHVNLPSYSKQEENELEDEVTINANTRALSVAIYNLFSVLSEWKQDASAQGLTFELSACSPSYYRHEKRIFHSYASSRRLLGRLLDTHIGSEVPAFPAVPIITRFSMNQRSHRKLSATALAMLMASMPGVVNVNYQPVWPNQDWAPRRERDALDLSILALFRSVYLSSSVQDLSLWEAQHNDRPICQRIAPDSLVSVAVLASYRLRNLAISNVIDAAQFFKCHESMKQGPGGSLSYAYWPNLMYLCLTTKSGRDNLNTLLVTAARVARQMPKLRILEVWCPKVGFTPGWDGVQTHPVAFFFRYDVRRSDTRLTVSATCRISLSEKILTAWQLVSDLHSQHKLDCRVKFIDARYYPQLYKRLRLYNLLRDWGPGIEH